MKILFIGDIVGKIGRKTVQAVLPKLKKELKPDLVIANAENIAHGSGVSAKTLKEVMEAGVDYFTCGDHAFKRQKEVNIYDDLPIIRPANYAKDAPGKGYVVIPLDKGGRGVKNAKENSILLINLIGRVFMDMDYDCPFHKLDEILAENLAGENLPRSLRDKALKNSKDEDASEQTLQNICKVWGVSAIIVDIHAEATSEKVAMGHYADGRASAVIGTHTHVQTADAQITKNGTGYITDAGMAGFTDGCIGIEKDGIIKTFLTQIKNKHIIPETGRAVLNGVLFEIDEKTGKAKNIKTINKFINIK